MKERKEQKKNIQDISLKIPWILLITLIENPETQQTLNKQRADTYFLIHHSETSGKQRENLESSRRKQLSFAKTPR